ncbi:hypothetical protein IPG41_05315 [Candidatus Peregrinibacteria bacterium]|nr:MAG: hypothetical protein IPG41_05315 [Candidatus Peregrinibacteria bacterium]
MTTTSWLSILPPVITIVLAMWSKKVLPSLLLGLLIGAYLLNPTPIGGLETALENIVKILSDPMNLQVLLFLYLFNGLITLIKNSGGMDAFSRWLGKYVKSDRGVLYTLWALIPVTFIDCDFRIVGSGSIMRSLAEKNKIGKERLAFMINNTASPVVELIPIATTFVGFNIANISQALEAAGVLEKQSAYSVLLHAIPFEFYSIVVLLITFSTIFFQWKKPSAEKEMHHTQEDHEGKDMSMGAEKPQIKPRIFNLIVPMLTVVSLSFIFFWNFATDPNMAMLLALSISIVVTGILYVFQKYPLKKMTEDMISGGNELMRILIILVIAWALGDVSQELGLSDFIQQLLGNQLPIWSIPVSLFLISSLVTYFIGEGWATASLIMPFAIFIAVSSGVSIPICVAAVITGGTFGDTTSPVAGMTNMASGVTGADHMKYLKYANPYNFASAGIAAGLFLIAGFLYHQ